MKVKVKSKEEIQKTLDSDTYLARNTDCHWSGHMDQYCGTVIDVEKSDLALYDYMIDDGDWYFVKEWVDVVEEDVKIGEKALFWDHEENRAINAKYIGTIVFDDIAYYCGIADNGTANMWKNMKPIEKKRMTKRQIEEELGVPIGSLEIVE